jgi:hypothetical protein
MAKAKVGVIAIGVVAVASIGINIVQAVRRSKVRKSTEYVALIEKNLIEKEDEREKLLLLIKESGGNADVIIRLNEEISNLKKELENKHEEISKLETKIDKQITLGKVIASMIGEPLENKKGEA